MYLEHIGIAVRSIEQGLNQWVGMFGYTQYTEEVINTRQQVRVVFLTKDGEIPVKLVAPVDNDSPLVTFLRKSGCGLHHLCFLCDSIEVEVARLTSQGARLLAGPEHGEAFD